MYLFKATEAAIERSRAEKSNFSKNVKLITAGDESACVQVREKMMKEMTVV